MVKFEDVAVLTIVFILAIFIYACMNGAADRTILLGDEVQTTDRYTYLFNDSFSGKVVMKMPDGVYIVRNINGTERTLSRHWLDKADAGTNELIDMRKR